MTLNIKKISHVLIISALGACATARVVKIQPGQGGVIAVMPAQSPEARQKAEAIMASNCQGKGFEITEEGEAVVGQRHNNNATATAFGLSSSGNSVDQTEWRLTYKCKTK